MTQQHPSERFQNGEVHSFYFAMATLLAQQEYEMDLSIRLAKEYGPSEVAKERENKRLCMEELRETIKQATEIYEKHVVPAIKRAADEMRKTNDLQLIEIAEAIETNDYRGLAL